MPLLSPRTQIILGLFVPQRRKPNPRYALSSKEKDLTGKTIIFTGGTDGIGREAVSTLHQMGANVVIVGRSEAKCKAILQELATTSTTGSASYELCDLTSMDSVKNCAERCLAQYPQIDVLVNCAGINATDTTFTEDGFETNWSVNYLAPYLLTSLLFERIQASKSPRIVNVTTNTDFVETFDIERLTSSPDFNTGDAYPKSKLALNMLTMDLADDMKDTGGSANVLYPGYIKSNLLRGLTGPASIMRTIMQIMASPTEVGSDRIVRMVASSKYADQSGVYVAMDDIRPPHQEAQNLNNRRRLAEITKLTLAKWTT